LIPYLQVCQLLSVEARLLTPVFQVGVRRLVLRPFTFSNGMTIPAGSLIGLPSSAVHMDRQTYSNPEQFDGFRFSKPHDGDHGVKTTGNSAVSISPDHLVFGLGRRAW
jgi:cytochrome P450